MITTIFDVHISDAQAKLHIINLARDRVIYVKSVKR